MGCKHLLREIVVAEREVTFPDGAAGVQRVSLPGSLPKAGGSGPRPAGERLLPTRVRLLPVAPGAPGL